jgi:hypothetical protein
MTVSLDRSIRTHFRTIDGLSVRFSESEEREDHALLLSPWPESLYAFEPAWQLLAERVHLVAIDPRLATGCRSHGGRIDGRCLNASAAIPVADSHAVADCSDQELVGDDLRRVT